MKSLYQIAIVLLLGVFSGLTFANNTVEVFLTHDMQISGIEDAHQQGYSITYYYLDAIDQIEQKMGQRASEKLQEEIDAVVRKTGLKNLVNLSEFQRNQLLLEQMKTSGIDLQEIQQSLVTPQDREAINHALQDLVYANDQGVTQDMLPAILFHRRVFKNTSDLSKVFDKLSQQGEE